MADESTHQVTLLLREWRGGDERALERLMPIVYEELRRLARGRMRGERSGHTLQTTALVNEAFMRLVDADVPWQDRAHFFAIAARTMRRILVDHAKSNRRAKRGGGAPKLSLHEEIAALPQASDELLALDEALTRLSEFDKRKGELVELHFFGGLTYDEAAKALEISPATVHRELRMAKAWLHRELTRESGSDAD